VAARAENRSAVRRQAGFADDDVPLAAVIARLTGQKGADLLVPIVPILRSIPLRLFVLGSGEADIADGLAGAAAAHPEWLSFVNGYDEPLAHLLHGAADLLLMPSRFEPCGLTQMQAMRYGAVPVVTDVGGLHDTVVDADDEPEGTGFRAPEATSVAFTSALFRASRHLSVARSRNALVGRGMKLDWSWRGPAKDYIALYDKLIDRSD
jgi:starch synthase